jgi:hypothetical protein
MDLTQPTPEPETSPNADRDARLEYLKTVLPPTKRPARWPRIVGIVLIILIVLGGATFGYVQLKQSTPVVARVTPAATPAASPSPAAVPTTHYDSTNYGLGLDYPQTWTVTDTAGSALVIRSAPMTITTATAQPTTGEIVLTIRATASSIPELGNADAVAVRDSQKISYKMPSSSQRAQTYVSFLQYNATTTKGALDGIYVTGDLGYLRLQTIPQTDLVKLNPLIFISFISCSTPTCTGQTTPINIPASAWDNASFSNPLEAMIESIQFS